MTILAAELHELCHLSGGKYDVSSLESAYCFVKDIAKGHYENFVVGSFLVPKKVAKYFYSIYAFARIGDDIADEITKTEDANEANALLTSYEESLNLIYNPSVNITIKNPIFLALKDTIEQNSIDIIPLSKLLAAFRSDIYFSQPQTFDVLLDYCTRSANPIGELILTLFGEHSAQALYYSNCICTALQLINFWQDISTDLQRNRCYIPNTLFNLPVIDTNYYEYLNGLNYNHLQDILEQCYSITDKQLDEGKNILHCVNSFRLKFELRAIIFMANKILTKIKKLKTDIIYVRPSL